MKFGDKLKNARIRCGMTQEEVIRQIGVTRQSLSNWENNRTYPDLASVVRLSDLYDVNLDDLLRDDMDLKRQMEERREQVKKRIFMLHDFAMLLIAGEFVLDWMDSSALGMVVGGLGLILSWVAHLMLARYLGVDWKIMALRSLAVVLLFNEVFLNEQSTLSFLLSTGGIGLLGYVNHRIREYEDPLKHITAFTGFVLALVIVFMTIPFAGDLMKRGDHVDNPFTSAEYLVAEVLQGETENVPRVQLSSPSMVWIEYPGEESYHLEGEFTYITQPEGAKNKGIWEMLDGDTLYRITYREDESVVFACYEKEQVKWEYLLEFAPIMGCAVKDVLGSSYFVADWYEAGTYEGSGGVYLDVKGTIRLTIPGDEPTVTVYEELWDGDKVEYHTLELTRDKRGRVEFYREIRPEGGEQKGIYRVPFRDGEFVFVLNFRE